MLLKCGRLSAKRQLVPLGDDDSKVYMEYICIIVFNEVWHIMREVFYQLKGQLTGWAGAYIGYFVRFYEQSLYQNRNMNHN